MKKKPLLLWGGVDISTSLYKQQPLKYTQLPNDKRDQQELFMIEAAKETSTPVVGVCRGAQLLCVYNGGSLYQHTEPRTQCHSIETREGYKFASVTAGHHQIMVPKGNHELIAWNPEETTIWLDDNDTTIIRTGCAEVVWFPKYNHLAVQPHPEWAGRADPFVRYINEVMKEKGIDYAF